MVLQQRSKLDETNVGVAISEISLSEQTKNADKTHMLSTMENFAASFREISIQEGRTKELIRGEEIAIELLQENEITSFTGDVYIGLLHHFSEKYPQPDQSTVWAKALLIQNFTKMAQEQGKTFDASFLITANLDLDVEIQSSGILRNDAFRTDETFDYLASVVSGTADMYVLAFDKLPAKDDKKYFVEKSMSSLQTIYSADYFKSAVERGNVLQARSRREEIDKILSGIRAEVAARIYFERFLDEVSGAAKLDDETLGTKFGSPEIVPHLRGFFTELYEVSKTQNSAISLRHSESTVDSHGRFDFEFFVEDTETGTETPLLLVEVKTYDPKEKGAGVRFSGAYAEREDRRTVVARKLETVIDPPLPDSSIDYVRFSGNSILSVRIPKQWTRQDNVEVPTLDRTVAINGRDLDISMHNMEGTVRKMMETKETETRIQFFQDATRLIHAQRVVKRLK